MDNRTKTALSLALVGLLAAPILKHHSSYRDIYNRFPDVDRKIARKAYNSMFRKALAQKYSADELSSDENMDKLFLAEVRTLTNQK